MRNASDFTSVIIGYPTQNWTRYLQRLTKTSNIGGNPLRTHFHPLCVNTADQWSEWNTARTRDKWTYNYRSEWQVLASDVTVRGWEPGNVVLSEYYFKFWLWDFDIRDFHTSESGSRGTRDSPARSARYINSTERTLHNTHGAHAT
jgi:hypothetical protein